MFDYSGNQRLQSARVISLAGVKISKTHAQIILSHNKDLTLNLHDLQVLCFLQQRNHFFGNSAICNMIPNSKQSKETTNWDKKEKYRSIYNKTVARWIEEGW